jgi:6-phosphogluconolactonase
MLDTLKICKEKNHEDASYKLYEMINSRILSNDNYNIGLSGGSTPKEFYKLLAKNNRNQKNITLWTVDDRHVSTESHLSNQLMIDEIFLNTSFNVLNYIFEENPHQSAEKYTELVLSNISKFNAAILGVGEDGHIASLFPNTKAIGDDSFGFVANEVNILSKWRITSTFALLEAVEDVFLLVTGDKKSSILKEIGKNNSLPVNNLINRREKTILITDQKI